MATKRKEIPTDSSSSFQTTISKQQPEPITVVLRVRPPGTRELHLVEKSGKIEDLTYLQYSEDTRGISPDLGKKDLQWFTLDQIFQPDTTQQELFENTAKKLIPHCLRGFNCSFIVYGQTSSGKTYTMNGVENNPGITPRSLELLFQLINNDSGMFYCILQTKSL
jgi:hypothetical protein